jgi:2-iminobutanoate/2-iminopropanoate deaminase
MYFCYNKQPILTKVGVYQVLRHIHLSMITYNYMSGQVSHDDNGNIMGRGDMEAQMRQAYKNIKKLLAQYGATIENVVDEILFVTDMDAAFAAAVKCRKEIFSGTPVIASTIVQIQRLAFPDLMIEISCVAKI